MNTKHKEQGPEAYWIRAQERLMQDQTYRAKKESSEMAARLHLRKYYEQKARAVGLSLESYCLRFGVQGVAWNN